MSVDTELTNESQGLDDDDEDDDPNYARGFEDQHNGLLQDPHVVAEQSIEQAPDIDPPARLLLSSVDAAQNQGARGTCASFAVSSAGGAVLRRNLSEQHLYAQTWSAEHPPDSAEGGTSIRGNARTLTDRGVCEEHVWPYDGRLVDGNEAHLPIPDAAEQGERHRIDNFNIIKLGANKSAQVVHLLAKHKTPIVAAVPILTEAGWGAGVLIDVPNRNEQHKGWHAIVIYGYDSVDQLLFVQNSWGWAWGFLGFAPMTMRYFDAYATEIAVPVSSS